MYGQKCICWIVMVFFFTLWQIYLNEILGSWVMRQMVGLRAGIGTRQGQGQGARGDRREERGERKEERRGQGEWTCVCCWSCQESLFWWTLQVNYCVVCQSFLIPSTYWHPFRLYIAYFSPALLGQHGYHGDSVTAVGLDAVWASNYDSCLSHCYYGFWQVLLWQFCHSF